MPGNHPDNKLSVQTPEAGTGSRQRDLKSEVEARLSPAAINGINLCDTSSLLTPEGEAKLNFDLFDMADRRRQGTAEAYASQEIINTNY